MKEDLPPADYEAFRVFLQDACGIVLGENKHYLVSSRLRNILEETGVSDVSALIEQISDIRNSALKSRIVDAMTTNETYWFRDTHPFQMLHEKILPELKKSSRGTTRIWSAACSSGQEPYSISIVTDECHASSPWARQQVEVLATDISPSMLELAREGIYDELALGRGLSTERRDRYFEPQGTRWRVKEPIRRRVKFMELNLMRNFSALGQFDVVFCRNVLIYFATDLKVDILNRLADALRPRGYLFLGGSESMANYCDRFETVRYKGGLAYRLKDK